jgi:serine/threonine protein phosphatase PrpC
MTVRTLALWGSDHLELGKVAIESLDDRCALALSRGRFPKGYRHLDPNEDAVVLATDGEAWLLAVTDGHSGFDAARASGAALLDQAETVLEAASADPGAAVRTAFEIARQSIAATLSALDEPRASSRTALSVGLIAGGQVHAATRGDTVVVLLREEGAEILGRRVEFLGPETELGSLRPAAAQVGPNDGLILATDGLYDFLGGEWLGKLAASAARLPSSHDLAADLVEQAFAGGSGDNIGVICWTNVAR